MIIGTEGAILLPHIGPPALYPAESSRARPMPTVHGAQPLARVPRCGAQGTGHHVCSASFDYASLVTEAVLLGSLAEHFPNEALAYDPAAMRFTSHAEPNRLLQRTYRKSYLMTRM